MTKELTPDEKAEVARFGVHDEPADVAPDWKPPKPRQRMPVEAFMLEEHLTKAQVGEVLREYRSAGGWSPYQGRDRVHADFLSWYRWERLA